MSIFIIIQIAGHQYKASQGDTVMVPKLNYLINTDIILQNILIMSDGEKLILDKLLLNKVAVRARVLEHKKLKKIIVFKMKRRCGYKRKIGHRQKMTLLKIEEILF